MRELGYLPGVLRKSSRSLSHLLMSSCVNGRPKSLRKLCASCTRSRLISYDCAINCHILGNLIMASMEVCLCLCLLF